MKETKCSHEWEAIGIVALEEGLNKVAVGIFCKKCGKIKIEKQ